MVRFNPRLILLRLPLVGLVTRKLQTYRKKAEMGVQNSVENVKHFSFRGGLVGLTMAMIVWISIFLYVAFYHAYIPSISHVRPLHVHFRVCNNGKGLCSNPRANILLTKHQQLFMIGQPYKIYIQLEMPESPANKNLGMFMVCAKLSDKTGHQNVQEACRSAMLRYRSPLLEAISTLTFSPFMLFGQTEEKQNVIVELFSDFEDDQTYPVTDVFVEIENQHIELYSATILIRAHFTGLRYLMFHWPILSATVGISSNLFFILLIFSLSWWHLSQSEESEGDIFNLEHEEPKKCADFQFEGDVESKEESTLEDLSLFEETTSSTPNPEKSGKLKTDLELSLLQDIKEPGIQEVPM